MIFVAVKNQGVFTDKIAQLGELPELRSVEFA